MQYYLTIAAVVFGGGYLFYKLEPIIRNWWTRYMNLRINQSFQNLQIKIITGILEYDEALDAICEFDQLWMGHEEWRRYRDLLNGAVEKVNFKKELGV